MSDRITREMDRAVEEGVFPAAQLLVVKGREVIYHAAHGEAVLDTIFDIASLTKPIATTILSMLLYDEGILDVKSPVSDYADDRHKSWNKEILVHHLLNHSSGLPAWRPYYREIPADAIGTETGKRLIIDRCWNEKLEYKIGEKRVYSDIGFIILGDIIERITKRPLDKLFEEKVARPLGLKSTFFIPLRPSNHRAVKPSKQFAPTENCPWRKKIIRGEVHDQNCYVMGGVAGHAGLFSNTSDIKRFTDEFLDCIRGRKGFIPARVIEKFLLFEPPEDKGHPAWLLGWDRPSREDNSAGRYFSDKTIGHLGYTGCSIWIDLERDFYTVLLTNRIHPSAENEKIKKFRPRIHDMIYEVLIK